jgi:hypothetical protein
MPQTIKEPVTDEWGGSFYRDRTGEFLDDKSSPFLGAEPIPWKTITASLGVFLGIFIIGISLYSFGQTATSESAENQDGSYKFGVVLATLVFMSLAGLLIWGSIKLYLMGNAEKQIRLQSDIRLKELREVARLGVAQNMTFADLQRMAHAANLSMAQYSAIVLGHVVENATQFEKYKRDRKDDRRREEFQREHERDQWRREENQADRQHKERMHKATLESEEAKYYIKLKEQKQDWDYQLQRLERQQTHDERIKTVTEISNIRAAMIGSLMELRANPALAGQINQIVTALDTVQQALDRPEFNTPDGERKREVFDQLLTQFLTDAFTGKAKA